MVTMGIGNRSSADGAPAAPRGHGHGSDLGLAAFIAYFFCISSLVSARAMRIAPATDEDALVAFLAFLGAACLTLLSLALAEPYLLRHNVHGRLAALSVPLLAAGPAYCALESALQEPNTLVLFSLFCLSGCGYGLCLLVWGRVLAAKDPARSARQVFADTCAAAAVMVVGAALPETATMVLMAALGVMAGSLGAVKVAAVPPEVEEGRQVVVSDTRAAIPRSSYFVGATLWLVYGIFWSLLGDLSLSRTGMDSTVTLGAILLAAVGVAIVRLHHQVTIDLSRAFWVSVPLLVTGLVFFVAGDEGLLKVAVLLIILSMVTSYMHLMAHFAALAHRPRLLADQLFAWGWLAPLAGMLAGVFLGLAFRSVGSAATDLFLPIAAGVLVIAVIASMHSIERIAAHKRDRAREAEAEAAAVEVAAQDDTRSMEDVFEAMGLSRREKDVAFLLMQGHSQAAIGSQLFVAASTVNTHVKHIYRKAAVNSKQEFLDLCQQRLEAERSGGREG